MSIDPQRSPERKRRRAEVSDIDMARSPPSPSGADDSAHDDSLFADDLGAFANPEQPAEVSMRATSPGPQHVANDDDDTVTYECVESATIRGKVNIIL